MADGMANYGSVVTVTVTRDVNVTITSEVIAGLDPAIHHLGNCFDEV